MEINKKIIAAALQEWFDKTVPRPVLTEESEKPIKITPNPFRNFWERNPIGAVLKTNLKQLSHWKDAPRGKYKKTKADLEAAIKAKEEKEKNEFI